MIRLIASIQVCLCLHLVLIAPLTTIQSFPIGPLICICWTCPNHSPSFSPELKKYLTSYKCTHFLSYLLMYCHSSSSRHLHLVLIAPLTTIQSFPNGPLICICWTCPNHSPSFSPELKKSLTSYKCIHFLSRLLMYCNHPCQHLIFSTLISCRCFFLNFPTQIKKGRLYSTINLWEDNIVCSIPWEWPHVSSVYYSILKE